MSFTRIPCPFPLSEAAFQRAAWHLPLIGWIWAFLLQAVLHYVGLPDDGLLFLCLLLPILLSGAMHEDGLADAADGLIGGQTREKRLEIMKDPRVGSYGVISLILCLLGQFLALRALPHEARFSALLFVLVMSRCIAAILSQVLPYARTENSRSAAYLLRSPLGLLTPTLWTLPACFFLAPDLRLPLVALSFLLLGSMSVYFWKKLGGITGDCLGAAVKISELVLLWALAGLLPL